MTQRETVYDPPPDPPAIVAYSYVLFGGFGILHLVLAALAECLQMLNLVLGLLHLLIAIVIAMALAGWRKKRQNWLAALYKRIGPEPKTGAT